MTVRSTELVEEIPCGVMSFAEDGSIVYTNPWMLKMLGYQTGELVGRHVNCILPVAGRVFLQTHMFPLLRAKGIAEEIYVSLQGKDGSSHPVLFNALRRASDSGIINICAVIKIGTRSLLEDGIIRMRNGLRDTNVKLTESIEEIRKISVLDELTNTPNRRSLMARLEQERLRTERSGVTFSVAIIDLDHFKDVNDTYGHHAGDEVLKLFSASASGAMRKVDLFGRYGGEEFLAIMTATDELAATLTINRVLAVAAAGNYSAIASGLAVSASAGISTHDTMESIQNLLERADKALYEAKRGGRNRVVQA